MRVFIRCLAKTFSLGFSGEAVSSTGIRVSLAFGKDPEALDERVLAFIRERGLYTHPAIAPALALEKPERREHSFRVAQMACARARSLRIPEEKALLAAALHDCAKYVPLSSPLLEGFPCPENVPPPVLHQYTGAYLAEQHFGIRDREVLDAIRYHTSGRAGMGSWKSSSIYPIFWRRGAISRGRNASGAVLERPRRVPFRESPPRSGVSEQHGKRSVSAHAGGVRFR